MDIPYGQTHKSDQMVLKNAHLILCVLLACDAGAEPAEQTDGDPDDEVAVQAELAVEVERVAGTSGHYPLRTLGAIEPATSHAVSIGAPGRVRSVHADVGDRVEAGTVLLRLDPKRDELAVQRARAQSQRVSVELTRAQQELARIEALRGEGITSAETLEQAQARVDLARAAAADARAAGRLARHERGQAIVRAPAAGVVTRRAIEDGERALPGEALLTIESDALEVATWISERDVAGVALGDVAIVSTQRSETFEARVIEIDRHAQGRTGNFGVRLALDTDVSPRPGQTVEVVVQVRAEAEVPTIPESALVSRERRLAAFVVERGRVRRVFVRLGPPRAGRVPVLEGIEPGTAVVVGGVEGLTDGQTITVAAGGMGPR